MNTKLSAKEKMQLMGNLGTMLAAGIPILETVESLLEEAKSGTKKVLTTLRDDLKAGTLVHQSFARFPNSFDKVTINLIKAAEEAGTLEVTLHDIKDNTQREIEFSDKIKSALSYPAFVSVVFIGVILMMLIVVMPKVSRVFTRLKMELPFATKALIFASDTLLNHTLEVLIVLGVIGTGFYLMYRFQRQVLMSLLFSLPLISNLVKQIDITRFSRNMYLLLNSGLPIVTALELAEDVVAKPELRHLLQEARKMVVGGKRLSEGLAAKKGVFPGMVVKLIEVGERSGSLTQSMKDISEALDYEVTKNLKNATALLEPLMLVAVGLAVGGIMLAIIGPIYSLISDVQVR